MNNRTVAKLPQMDDADIRAVVSIKKGLTKVSRDCPQAITTIAMIEVIHEIASLKACPSEYRVLVAPLLRKLADDIDAIEENAPKIVVPS